MARRTPSAPAGAIKITKNKRKHKEHRAGGGVRQGAVWNSLRHETGRCLGLAASRNRALAETRYATERGAEAQRRTLATARRRALAEHWEHGGWQVLARRWGGHPCARAKFIRGWQDLCAMHDLRASDGESAPWWQDVRAAYSPTALCGSFWTHSTHILPKLAVFGYMQAICCHELAFFSSRPLRERIRTIYCRGQAGGMYGAAANAGDRHPQREGRGRRRMTRFPHQNKGSRPTPSSPKQKKASALLAFFRCSVYDSNDPRDLHGNKPLPFGILSD